MTQLTSGTSPLYSSLGDDPELAEIVDMFVDEMPDRLATVLSQLEASDWEGLRRTAHQLKGAAGSYGFDQVTPFAAKVEGTIQQGDQESEIRNTVDELVKVCQRIRGGAPS